MSRVTRTETRQGACVLVHEDGTRVTTETTWTTTDDWREIDGLGRVNFGEIIVGPQRLVYTPPLVQALTPRKSWSERLAEVFRL